MSVEISVESLTPGPFFEEWSALARTSPSGVFATPEWHLAVQKAYAHRGKATVLACWEHGRLVGAAPLRFSSHLLLRDATWLGMGQGGYGLGDYSGLLSAPGRERDVARPVLAWLIERGGWDLLDLQQLPAGELTEALVEAIRRSGLRFVLRPHNTCHVIDLPSTWAAYRSRLSSSTRDWLERKPRKAERELQATVELVGSDDLLAEYATMRRFQADRFGSHSAASERKLTVVIAEWLQLAHDRNWLRMFRLRAGARTIGVLLGYEYGNAFYFHSAAFETLGEGSKYSLGASLLSAALRFSIDRGLQRFDMLRGHYEYKGRLGSEKRYNYRIIAFRSSVTGRAVEAGLHMRAMLKGTRPWRRDAASPLVDLPAVEASESPARVAEDLAGAAVRVE